MWNYQVLAGLYPLAASLIWGVNTLFLLDAGLSIQEVFIANAVFSGGMVLFEIPTGVVADTVGRRVSFLLSIVVLAARTILYLLAARAGAGVWTFAAVSLFMGLGLRSILERWRRGWSMRCIPSAKKAASTMSSLVRSNSLVPRCSPAQRRAGFSARSTLACRSRFVPRC